MSILPKQMIRDMISDGDLKTGGDIQEYFKGMFKEVMMEMLEAEMEMTLGYTKGDRENKKTENRRNGHTKKNVNTTYGDLEIVVPRDRKGEFEPIIVPKNSRSIAGIEEKVIAMYARGLSTRDISAQIEDIYGFELSAESVSKMTNSVIEKAKEWQNRPLEELYTFVFMDAIHYKVREDNKIKCKAAYVVLGVNKEGEKDILGIWIGESESSKFWLSILTELKNRGIKDVLIFSVDGLTGFKEAISAAFPNSVIQRCIIHQLRNSFKYVSYKHVKEFTTDFKTVYTAVSESSALDALDKVEEKWGKEYPTAIRSWRNNWDVLSPFFQYSAEIRKIMYTTNIIEGLHRQFRKVTKTKTTFPSDDALLKMLFLASEKVMEKWTMRYKNWDTILDQLSIFFEGRI